MTNTYLLIIINFIDLIASQCRYDKSLASSKVLKSTVHGHHETVEKFLSQNQRSIDLAVSSCTCSHDIIRCEATSLTILAPLLVSNQNYTIGVEIF